jgi:hypothetical protein
LHALFQHLLAAPAQQQMRAAVVERTGDRPADAARRARQQNPAVLDSHGRDPNP